MKRRRFFQYTGLGGLSLVAAAQSGAIASILGESGEQRDLGLTSFEFQVTTVDRAGHLQQPKSHTANYFPESINSVDRLDMVQITPGKFLMGAPRSEPQAKGEELPRQQVNLSSFFLSKYPITQAQWAAVVALPKVSRELHLAPSHFQGSNRPVESVSWLDATEFCQRLSQHTGRPYQLPSEAQWEYACRAGTTTPFSTGETIVAQLADYRASATYKAETPGEYRHSTVPVGSFSANGFGLHDMHGNVWEWCADGWHRNHRGAFADGRARRAVAVAGSQLRVIRGGGWLDAPEKLRSASRSGYAETALNRTIGFRVMTMV
ncbi:formylglycine-generating enzyme family protein [Leptothoe sp. PORK10 BA2]|uniref:formylglycine-generating enzyme family protein n=1 Tax=Leptothoe sp. PORK10 BA2 TaxID=3110254 RepID=UPI002B20FEF6|nr:formylglycine-generating enzyme family protein [Leptothoe sp. PORK10 BA2]MEA5464673.1 formylglycine-generating enzyme family protein [Leptothoe sp. PORK10 BA2]